VEEWEIVGEATILNQYTKIALVESFRLSFQLSLTSYLVVFVVSERTVFKEYTGSVKPKRFITAGFTALSTCG
jgi:hypothetical protein